VTAGRTGPEVTAARARLAEADEQALALNREAAAGWDRFAIWLGVSEALFGAGRCLLALGRSGEAAAKLAEAREVFTGLGARSLVAQVDDLSGETSARVRA
jgi:hypothetical protein